MTIRILNVNDTLDLRSGGGTAERTFQMSRFLARQGAVCEVLTINSEQLDASRIAALKPSKVTVLQYFWRRFRVPLWNWKLIRQAVDDADIIHLMGHWSILNALVYVAARRSAKPYVICPAGALPLFGRSKWLKRCYNFLVGNGIVRNASAWIAVTKGEFDHFESYGIASSLVTVIPNGVSEEDFPVMDVTAFKRRCSLPDEPIILFMGRLNPIKGPDLLLDAFISARNSFSNFHLVFAGPDGGMLTTLKKVAVQKGVSEFVHFLGFVSGADKVAAYRMANLLVVPSRQEAMSIVAVEAGFCGTPVMLTDQCGFGEIKSIDSRLEVPATVSGIASGLTSLLSDSSNLAAMSQSWSVFVKQRYSWSSLAPEYVKLYRTILSRPNSGLPPL
ncbi:MAG: glycosyltransferase [Gallionellaceae bacterium]|jgi:glycosyltransferase involved in cell wall biosynthesis